MMLVCLFSTFHRHLLLLSFCLVGCRGKHNHEIKCFGLGGRFSLLSSIFLQYNFHRLSFVGIYFHRSLFVGICFHRRSYIFSSYVFCQCIFLSFFRKYVFSSFNFYRFIFLSYVFHYIYFHHLWAYILCCLSFVSIYLHRLSYVGIYFCLPSFVDIYFYYLFFY